MARSPRRRARRVFRYWQSEQRTLRQGSISFLQFVTISVVGGALGSALILGLTVGLSIISSRRVYDLDTVSSPIVTAACDMVTVPSLFLAPFIPCSPTVNPVVAAICIVI